MRASFEIGFHVTPNAGVELAGKTGQQLRTSFLNRCEVSVTWRLVFGFIVELLQYDLG
jgi:hypothetical protein